MDNSFENVGVPTPIETLANGGKAVASASGHDLALGLPTADIAAVDEPQATKRRRILCKGPASFSPAANTVYETHGETILVVAQVVPEAVIGTPTESDNAPMLCRIKHRVRRHPAF
jgi:hypothetical protein